MILNERELWFGHKGRLLMTRTVVHAPAAGNPVGPYSQAVIADGWVFVSAEKGVDPNTGKTAVGVGPQTDQCLKNIRAVLSAAGAEMTDIVRCVVYLKDIKDFPLINEIYGEFFQADPPARTTVEVSNLPLGLAVMIEATARIPS
jgi:2-iminobutanoate/2-iminopropanoate deaminase